METDLSVNISKQCSSHPVSLPLKCDKIICKIQNSGDNTKEKINPELYRSGSQKSYISGFKNNNQVIKIRQAKAQDTLSIIKAVRKKLTKPTNNANLKNDATTNMNQNISQSNQLIHCVNITPTCPKILGSGRIMNMSTSKY